MVVIEYEYSINSDISTHPFPGARYSASCRPLVTRPAASVFLKSVGEILCDFDDYWYSCVVGLKPVELPPVTSSVKSIESQHSRLAFSLRSGPIITQSEL